MKFFEVLKKSKKSKARTGVLHTPHGDILTPAFVPVATKGTLKTIPPKDFKDISMQVAFVNTFHLTLHPGVDVIRQFGGIHQYARLPIPLMSDSAGFQVFSLGTPKFAKGEQRRLRPGDEREPLLLKISDDGALFRSPRDGKELLFTPEVSIKNQEKIGADILMAFDECIPSGVDYEYAKQATQRTHEWLVRCVEAKKRKEQRLYGIVQGGIFKDLRIQSAQFVEEQDIDGIAIGGVSVGETKKEMEEQVGWVVPYLPEKLPRHLLGIGRIEDIQKFVLQGMDTFDCVEATRLARNGIVFQRTGSRVLRVDLLRATHLRSKGPIQVSCSCYTCKNFSLSFLHHLYKEKELLGYYLATWHNLFFFEQFFKELRQNIAQGKL